MASHNLLKVVIIDDTPEMTRLLTLALDDSDHEIVVVESMPDAIDICTKSCVILTDCRIPELALREIQRLRVGQPIVLIVPRGVETREVSGVIVLSKPFELNDLFGAIERAASRCELQSNPCNLQH